MRVNVSRSSDVLTFSSEFVFLALFRTSLARKGTLRCSTSEPQRTVTEIRTRFCNFSCCSNLNSGRSPYRNVGVTDPHKVPHLPASVHHYIWLLWMRVRKSLHVRKLGTTSFVAHQNFWASCKWAYMSMIDILNIPQSHLPAVLWYPLKIQKKKNKTHPWNLSKTPRPPSPQVI